MYINWLLSALVFAGYMGASTLISNVIRDVGQRKNAAPKRAIYVSKIFSFAVALVCVFLLFIIWGVGFDGVVLFGTSVLAITGVALFAQWSLLSNLTASVVIFFSYPARIGDRIRVIDGDNSVEGVIIDINMFQVLIEDDNQNIMAYPNNLLVQKPFVKLCGVGSPVVGRQLIKKEETVEEKTDQQEKQQVA
ncbi:MAG: mechanosensitive ion channel family protein [Gammaproteobacteria bacterium]